MTNDKKSSAKGAMRFLPVLGAFLAGAIVMGLVGWLAMPSMMLSLHQSRFDTVEETCQELQASIKANGWGSPPVRNMNMTMEKHGVQMEQKIRIVELCNAQYAKDVLVTNPEVSTLMPCAWGVYKGTDGKIYISGMNMGLMGKMFGGNIAEVMGGAVAVDEAKILSAVIVP